MSLAEIDSKAIIMLVAGSLTAYVFYGHIELEATVQTIKTRQEQVINEQRDIWEKYNDDLKEKVVFMKEYYDDKIEQQKEWKELYKTKYQDISKRDK